MSRGLIEAAGAAPPRSAAGRWPERAARVLVGPYNCAVRDAAGEELEMARAALGSLAARSSFTRLLGRVRDAMPRTRIPEPKQAARRSELRPARG